MGGKGPLALGLSLLLALPSLAGAQRPAEERPPPLLSGPAAEGPSAGWLRWMAEAEGRRGVVAPSRLDALRGVVELLEVARQRAAALDEGGALAALGRARQRLEALADVPGSARWLAEVELTLATVAHQAGRSELVEQALGRLASLAPGRTPLPGEAPPELLPVAARLRGEAARRAPGLLVVRSEPPGAELLVDDEPVGRAPTEVRLSAGVHLLRLQAPGMRAWGTVVRIEAGRRSELDVRLAPTETMQAAERLWERVRALRQTHVPAAEDVTRLVEEARRLGQRGYRVRWFHVTGDEAGLLAFACDARGCVGPARGASQPEVRAVLLGRLAAPARRAPEQLPAAMRRALWRPATPRAPRPHGPRDRWGRWPTWVLLGAAAVGIGLAGWAVATSGEAAQGPRPVRLRFDPAVPLPSGG